MSQLKDCNFLLAQRCIFHVKHETFSASLLTEIHVFLPLYWILKIGFQLSIKSISFPIFRSYFFILNLSMNWRHLWHFHMNKRPFFPYSVRIARSGKRLHLLSWQCSHWFGSPLEKAPGAQEVICLRLLISLLSCRIEELGSQRVV